MEGEAASAYIQAQRHILFLGGGVISVVCLFDLVSLALQLQGIHFRK